MPPLTSEKALRILLMMFSGMSAVSEHIKKTYEDLHNRHIVDIPTLKICNMQAYNQESST